MGIMIIDYPKHAETVIEV